MRARWHLAAITGRADDVKGIETRMTFEDRIAKCDQTLFDGVPTISSQGDRLSWLALQSAVRQTKGEYVYLEIGSYVGGSLQQYYLDPRCNKIYSIDKRPERQADERGDGIVYENNTQRTMMDNLARRGQLLQIVQNHRRDPSPPGHLLHRWGTHRRRGGA